MTKESITEAQDYLSVRIGDGFIRIIDIRGLIKRHSANEIIEFLKECLKEKQRVFKDTILMDKTDPKVDELIASMFRLKMSINSLERGKEVFTIGSEQGAKEGRRIHKRDSGGNNRTGCGKDISNDGEDRKPGQTMQRAA